MTVPQLDLSTVAKFEIQGSNVGRAIVGYKTPSSRSLLGDLATSMR